MPRVGEGFSNRVIVLIAILSGIAIGLVIYGLRNMEEELKKLSATRDRLRESNRHFAKEVRNQVKLVEDRLQSPHPIEEKLDEVKTLFKKIADVYDKSDSRLGSVKYGVEWTGQQAERLSQKFHSLKP